MISNLGITVSDSVDATDIGGLAWPDLIGDELILNGSMVPMTWEQSDPLPGEDNREVMPLPKKSSG